MNKKLWQEILEGIYTIFVVILLGTMVLFIIILIYSQFSDYYNRLKDKTVIEYLIQADEEASKSENHGVQIEWQNKNYMLFRSPYRDVCLAENRELNIKLECGEIIKELR